MGMFELCPDENILNIVKKKKPTHILRERSWKIFNTVPLCLCFPQKWNGGRVFGCHWGF